MSAKTRKLSTVGKSVPRKEGVAKVRGEARYIDDISFPDMIYGATIRSSVPRGRIRSVAFEPGFPWDEFTIVTAEDIPGKNFVPLLTSDQPFLAADLVNHPEEPIALIAHADRYMLEEARKRVRLTIDPLPAVFSIEEALAKKTIVWGKDNVLKSYRMNKGDVDQVWERADFIVEGEYQTGAQEQLYIENHGVIAVSGEGGVTVWGSMQCPYYVHKALVNLFDLPPEKIRIVQTETGGGFGGKEDYPSLIAGHAALLAHKAKRPVKIIYDRAEDMVATTKRHPSRTRHRTAVTKEGQLLAMEIDFVIDGGAYTTLSPVVLSRGTIHAAGAYLCPHVRIQSKAVATNAPPHGAFRGFGAPQSLFALERHMDEVAQSVGLSPQEFRRRNFLKPGDLTATEQVIKDPVDMRLILDQALKETDFERKRKQFKKQNEKSTVKKGIGLASFFHGCGFTGSGEAYLASKAGVELTKEGRVRVIAASTEIGQGTNTIFAQIASETLELPYDEVEVAQPDTANVPNSGPTVASRTCMIVGQLIKDSCLGLVGTLKQSGLLKEEYSPRAFEKAARLYLKKFGKLRVIEEYRAPEGVIWDDENYRGDAYGAFGWAVYVAEVSVDTVTYEVRVDDFLAVQDIGRVIHPVLAGGQVEGGVAQAIGYAIYEKVVWKEGRMANGQMTNYIMPTSMDAPPIRVKFVENLYANGPYGAKGVGELPMDGPAPAILNAIENAIGKSFHHIPLLPEDLRRGMQGA